MALNEFISTNAIIPSLKVTTKKQALTEISEHAAAVSGLGAREIFDALWQREKLGSTGVGGGIAIPHGKLAKAGRIFGIFARLDRPIDYDAVDGAPVDLLFVLIAPETAGADHLKALAQIARTLRDPALVASLRGTRDSAGLYTLLTQSVKPHAA